MARYLACSLVVLLVAIVTLSEAQNIMQVSDAAVNAAIRSPRYMRRQINCLLGESSCDNIGNQLKRATPSLLAGQCPGCTPQQHQQANKVLRAVSEQYPAEYSRIYYMYSGRAGQRAPGK